MIAHMDMNTNTEYLDIFQLAAVIHLKPAAIRNRLARGKPLPRSFRLPECTKRLWKRSDVLEWMESNADWSPEQPAMDPKKSDVSRRELFIPLSELDTSINKGD